MIEILETCNSGRIEWTFTAENSWQPFGLEQEAYEILIMTLKHDEVLGHQVVGMLDGRDGSHTDCWAFLCPHPWGSPVPIYAKIGIHHSQVHINLFSLHVDDGSEKLQNAIKAYRKKYNRR